MRPCRAVPPARRRARVRAPSPSRTGAMIPCSCPAVPAWMPLPLVWQCHEHILHGGHEFAGGGSTAPRATDASPGEPRRLDGGLSNPKAPGPLARPPASDAWRPSLPLARVRCSCTRGERPREGLAAAVAVEKRCRPRFPWTAPLPPWAVCPSSQGLLLPLVGADEVAQAGAALADDVEGDDVHADALGLGVHREPEQGEACGTWPAPPCRWRARAWSRSPPRACGRSSRARGRARPRPRPRRRPPPRRTASRARGRRSRASRGRTWRACAPPWQPRRLSSRRRSSAPRSGRWPAAAGSRSWSRSCSLPRT